ncbi:hypothetical protein C2845_PM03G23360 [Panicum miliaceum]|uniref:Bifunctional inhibitor/plant lipid transfer protein/seed storage helical domain-containing protein n=1 Tax=Panicum miliaceum TaxID=4540 RepID=A0A3L6TE92_PANMI|nr:hypothetical protein C2845_PM03G23360 [Panicum miliaceum]
MMMMPTKAAIQLLVFSLVFTLCVVPHDCYREKQIFERRCAWSIRRGRVYLHPNPICCRTVRKIDMARVCAAIQPREEETIDVRHVY